MTGTWSNQPPTEPCFAIFRGFRHAGKRNYGEQLYEPVEVCVVWRGKERELGVAMTGRATRFRLEFFEGEWFILTLEAA